MNDLYLIGNGFDLAHGLKTSYNDFLLWYLNDSLQLCNSNGFFNDDLITIKRNGYQYSSLKNYRILKELLEEMKRMRFSIKYNHDFFKDLVESYREYKWVDIEYEYYIALVDIYRGLEKTNLIRSDLHFSQLTPLNNCFEAIRKKLVEYLSKIEITEGVRNPQIKNVLMERTGINGVKGGKKMFLYFNYTNTIDLYCNWSFDDKIQVIHIHGKLSDKSNPIIFGYGDEMDTYFNKIKQLNLNDFLVNMKSYDYLKTSNLQKLNEFLDEGKYTVKIMGHSCGVSDRVLLNRIFEHQNCDRIKIFYHEKENTDDYSDKIREISRHLGHKNILDLVCQKGISEPMIPYAMQTVEVQM